ncbi:DUF3558 family protein [Gordonia sp. NPDC003950]
MTRPTMFRRAAGAVFAVPVATALAACGSPSDTASESSAPAISDPCTAIGDNLIRELDLNPATRTPVTPTGTETSACEVSSSDTTVRFSQSTTTFEAYRDSHQGNLIGVNVNQRPAVIVRSQSQCTLAMKDNAGITSLRVTVSVTALEWGMNPCGHIESYATTIEPTIPPLA